MTSGWLAFIVAVAVGIAVGRSIIGFLESLRVRQTISDDAPERHRTKQGTPTMGGLIIFAAVIVGVLAGFASRSIFSKGLADPGTQRLWPVIFLFVACAATGFVDDYLIATRGKNLGLKARQKLAAQFVSATVFVVWITTIRRTDPTSACIWGDRFVELGWLYYPLAVLLIVGMSNAVNLTDGLDGLAGGLSAISALALGLLVMGAMGVNLALVIFAFAIAGGCIGFLWYNRNPARVFMGDIGSLALGGGLAGIGLAGRRESMVLVVGLIFVLEALSVVIQVVSFKTRKKRVFKMTPIHHHFELSGWPEQTIVRRFWVAQLVIAFAALLSVGFFRI